MATETIGVRIDEGAGGNDDGFIKMIEEEKNRNLSQKNNMDSMGSTNSNLMQSEV